ncbi:MAG: hypothetical protein P4L22_03395 [Candidatus Babeliales bacterium]|nr:hypothetical protein [Candidatus Babeliales bacterium]
MLLIKLILACAFICNNFAQATQKEAVFVLGAPRSGTSAVMGVLQILGINLGDNIRNYPLPWNLKGDFEDNDITDIDADILWDLKIDPYDKNLHLMKFKFNELLNQKNKVKDLLNKRFRSFKRYAIKHPKMCLVLPLYIQAAQELGYKIKLIIVLRKPKEILSSNIANTNKLIREFTSEQEAIIYLFNFWHAIFKYSVGCEKLIITFDQLLNKTEATVKKIKTFLPGLKNFSEVKTQVNSFLDKDLKHY